MHIESHLDVDVIAHEATDRMTCMLQLVAPTPPTAAARPGQTLIIVLDRSGSMTGPPLEAAKQSIHALLRRLAPQDRFGLVVFDDQAQVLIPVRSMPEHDLPVVHQLVEQTYAGASTNLHAGYSLALREARRALRKKGEAADAATILLISDGHANHGVTDPDRLRQMADLAYDLDTVTSTTIGLGLGYDETVLAAIAVGGSGNHRFAADADELPATLAEEAGAVLDKSVLAATIRVTGCDGHLTAVGVPQDLPARMEDDATVITVGDLYAGERRNILVRLNSAPLAELGLATIAELTVEFTALPEQREHRITVPVTVNVVPGDEAAGRVPAPIVVVEELLAETASAKAEASRQVRDGDTDAARTSLGRASRSLDSLHKALDVLRRHGELDETSATDLQRLLSTESDEIESITTDLDTMPTEYTSKTAMSSATRSRTGRRTSGSDTEPPCPQCGETLLPIMWGLPMSDPGPGVILGGCCVPFDEPTHGCKACGWEGTL